MITNKIKNKGKDFLAAQEDQIHSYLTRRRNEIKEEDPPLLFYYIRQLVINISLKDILYNFQILKIYTVLKLLND